jgi:hypothetical protein
MPGNDGRPGEGNRAAADDDLPESGQVDDSRSPVRSSSARALDHDHGAT